MTLREALRSALNATAMRWAPTDWNPLATQNPNPVQEIQDPTSPVVAGPAQVGWGYVDGSLAPLIARVASGAEAAPDVPPEYAAFMAQYQAARESLWG